MTAEYTLDISEAWRGASLFEDCEDTATAFFSVTWDNDTTDPDKIGPLVPTATLEKIQITNANWYLNDLPRDKVLDGFGAKTVEQWEAQIEDDLRDE